MSACNRLLELRAERLVARTHTKRSSVKRYLAEVKTWEFEAEFFVYVDLFVRMVNRMFLRMHDRVLSESLHTLEA